MLFCNFLKKPTQVLLYVLLLLSMQHSWTLHAQATGGQQQESTAAKDKQKGTKELAAAKKKASLVGKLFKKFSAAAQQAKKLDNETRDSLQIFGWHVYWMDSAMNNYNYNSLSTLSYYACTLGLKDSSFTYTTPRWNSPATAQLIKLAKGDDCTVLLTVECSDENTLSYLLDNSAVQQASCNELMKLIDSVQQADGITLIFENLPPSRSAQLTGYVKNLSSLLKASGKYLALVLPPNDYENAYDIKALDPLIDQFILKGFGNQNGSKPQPLAPLESSAKWGPLSISRSVRDYEKAGLPKSKLILALPAQGAVWSVDSLSNHQVRHRFAGHKHYGELMSKINPQSLQYDSASQTVSGQYQEKGTTYHAYFDNDQTLNAKIAWVKKQGLAGVAIWALGYDHGRKELWQTLDKHAAVVKLPSNSLEMEKITAAKTQKQIATDSTAKASQLADIQVPSFLQKYEPVLHNPKVLMVAGFTLLLFLILGVVLSLFYPEVHTRLMIDDLKTYFKVTVIFMSIFASLMLTFRLIFQDVLLSGEINQLDNDNLAIPLLMQKYLWAAGLVIWLMIQAFSIKTFFNLNTDLP